MYLALRLCRYRVRSHYPPAAMRRDITRAYRRYTGRTLDLDAPQSYSQKLCAAKLRATPQKTRLTDKLRAREWVAERIGAEYLPPLYGVYGSFAEIDFDALPQSFVIKCSHDSGSAVRVRDKSRADLRQLERQFTFYMRRNFAYLSFELHYKDIPPRILIEKDLSPDGRDLRDYKFLCFHGRPRYCWVDTGRFTEHRRITYDMDWRVQPFVQHTYPPAQPEPRPRNFAEMKRIAAVLCRGFDQVRVDLYNVQGRVYFGEMTFTNGGGYEAVFPEKWDIALGALWRLENGPG